MRVGPSAPAVDSRLHARTCSYVVMIESSRGPSLTGGRRPSAADPSGDLGRGLVTGPPPGPDPAVEDVQSIDREAVQPQHPVAADGLAVEADVVVDDHAVPGPDAPTTQDGRYLVGTRDQPFALGIAGLGRGPAEGDFAVQVAVHGARDVAPVVDATVRGDVHEAQVGIAEMVGEPVRVDQPAGIVGGAHGAESSSRTARRVRSGR